MALENIGYNQSVSSTDDGKVSPGHHVEVINCGTLTTLTASDSGAICIFDTAANGEFILPTPVAGMYFDFRFGILTSGAYKVTTKASTEFLRGTISSFTTDITEVDSFVADGTSDVGVSMNGTTTGGDAGGWISVVATSATIWELQGDLYCGTATPSTPVV